MTALMATSRDLERPASNLQQSRLGLRLTQADLSARPGVLLGTLKKVEQIGRTSTEAVIKLLIALGAAGATVKASEPEIAAFASIGQVLDATPRPAQKRGWRT